MEKDIGEMKPGRVQAPNFVIQPVRKRQEGSIKRHHSSQALALFIHARKTPERSQQKFFEKVGTQNQTVFADKIFIIPEKAPLHRRQEKQ